METPKVSVVIPVYNAEKFLIETLESVRNQTFRDFECVLVNDGSTDNSLEIINRYSEDDNRFRCISIANSGCANIPRNVAIRSAVGEFVFYLDADDVIELSCIEKIIERQSITGADIVLLTTIGCIEELNGELWRLPRESYDMCAVISGLDACKLTIGGWQISCAGMLALKDLFHDIPKGNLIFSDEVTSRFLLHKASKVAFSDAIYYYRNNSQSITKAISPRIFERLLIDKILDDFVSERFQAKDEVSIKQRNTRFFNLVYLYYDYVKNKSGFGEDQKKTIFNNFRLSYQSQNFALLKEELPEHFTYLFLTSFRLFRVVAFFYVAYKTIKERKYLYK